MSTEIENLRARRKSKIQGVSNVQLQKIEDKPKQIPKKDERSIKIDNLREELEGRLNHQLQIIDDMEKTLAEIESKNTSQEFLPAIVEVRNRILQRYENLVGLIIKMSQTGWFSPKAELEEDSREAERLRDLARLRADNPVNQTGIVDVKVF